MLTAGVVIFMSTTIVSLIFTASRLQSSKLVYFSNSTRSWSVSLRKLLMVGNSVKS